MTSPLGPAAAEPPPRPPAPIPLAEAAAATPALSAKEAEKLARQADLEAVRREQTKAAERETALKSEIESIAADRRKFNQALITTAARIRDAESRIAAGEARLKSLDDREQAIRSSLNDRRAVIAEVLAAMQRIGRRPPPALMVRPQDALKAVRTALLLGAVLPDMRIEAQSLSADLAELVRIRKAVGDEKAKASAEIAALTAERRRMALLIEERQRRQAESERALAAENDHIATLARQADSLQDLIVRIERDISAARAVPSAADTKDGAAPARPDLAALKDPGRLTPAIAFADAKGALPLPVNGVRLRGFGAADGMGGTVKGISIATRAGAQVTAPCDGWVVYAGPFRSYGQLLILNAGGGYHVLLAGMERMSVDLGQFVLTGEPVAVMGNGSPAAALIPIGSGQPVLYVEFRKDGVPVDPSPWWATKDSEKVRG